MLERDGRRGRVGAEPGTVARQHKGEVGDLVPLLPRLMAQISGRINSGPSRAGKRRLRISVCAGGTLASMAMPRTALAGDWTAAISINCPLHANCRLQMYKNAIISRVGRLSIINPDPNFSARYSSVYIMQSFCCRPTRWSFKPTSASVFSAILGSKCKHGRLLVTSRHPYVHRVDGMIH